MGLPFSKMGRAWWEQVEGWIGDQDFVSGPGEHLNEAGREAVGYRAPDSRGEVEAQV